MIEGEVGLVKVFCCWVCFWFFWEVGLGLVKLGLGLGLVKVCFVVGFVFGFLFCFVLFC